MSRVVPLLALPSAHLMSETFAAMSTLPGGLFCFLPAHKDPGGIFFMMIFGHSLLEVGLFCALVIGCLWYEMHSHDDS